MALIDIVNELTQVGQSAQNKPAPLANQAEITKGLYTAITGKTAGQDFGSGRVTLEQQQQAMQTEAELQQVDQGKQAQNVQTQIQNDQIKQAFEQKVEVLDEQKLAQYEYQQNKVASILQKYQQNVGTLNLEVAKSQAEQIGFMMRLSNEQYISQLKMNGEKARLKDAIAFKEALAADVFSEEHKLFTENLRFRSMILADSRAFEKEMEMMSLEDAFNLAMEEKSAKETAATYSALAGIAGIGISGAAGFASSKLRTDERDSSLPELSESKDSGESYDSSEYVMEEDGMVATNNKTRSI